MDYGGACLVALAIVILMIALNKVSTWGASSPQFWIAISVSVILLIVFVIFERRQAHKCLLCKRFIYKSPALSRSPLFLRGRL